MAKTRVVIEGPLFTGEADEAAREFLVTLTRELAEVGATWIKTEAHGFDKSGRNTGAAADGVEVIDEDGVPIVDPVAVGVLMPRDAPSRDQLVGGVRVLHVGA